MLHLQLTKRPDDRSFQHKQKGRSLLSNVPTIVSSLFAKLVRFFLQNDWCQGLAGKESQDKDNARESKKDLHWYPSI